MRLFEPTGISFKIAYPELGEYEAFSNITDSEYGFIWHMGCKDSPIYGLAEKERLLESLKLVPDFSKKLSQEEYNQYILAEIPERIKSSIKQMSSFEPELRFKSKVFTDRYLEYANKVTSMDIDEWMGSDVEIAELKTFMSLQTEVTLTLPKIIRNAEQGFGYVQKGKEKENTDVFKVLEQQ